MQIVNREQTDYYLPNKMGRIFILSHEEILGQTSYSALLNTAGLSEWIGHLPENDLDPGFSFTTSAGIYAALEKIYGTTAARGIALRTGHAAFRYGLREFAALLGFSELSFRLLPLQKKIRHGLEALTRLYDEHSDQVTRLEQTEHGFLWHIDRCPYCWGQESLSPCCHHPVGIFQEALHWISGGKYFQVEETSCRAAGAPSCTISIHTA